MSTYCGLDSALPVLATHLSLRVAREGKFKGHGRAAGGTVQDTKSWESRPIARFKAVRACVWHACTAPTFFASSARDAIRNRPANVSKAKLTITAVFWNTFARYAGFTYATRRVAAFIVLDTSTIYACLARTTTTWTILAIVDALQGAKCWSKHTKSSS